MVTTFFDFIATKEITLAISMENTRDTDITLSLICFIMSYKYKRYVQISITLYFVFYFFVFPVNKSVGNKLRWLFKYAFEFDR